MELKIKTTTLQEMVARSIKGVSNNKMIPITSLMSIELENNQLTLTTTDAINYLYIREDKVDGEDFSVTVYADSFAKLISRLTCETTTISINEEKLNIKGNGDYSIELPLDEEGQLIKYPNPIKNLNTTDIAEVNLSTIFAILTTVRPALATTLDMPCYTGYYVGDSVVGTDTFKIASMDVKLWEEPRIVSAEMMNLLSVMTDEKIKVSATDSALMWTTQDCIVYGSLVHDLNDFSIDAINNLVESEFDSMCKLPKSTLLQVLDRLSLFVGAYDKNGIDFTFTKQGLQISSKSSSGVEMLEYVESKNFKDFVCTLDIGMILGQVKAQATDMVELWYGHDSAVKLVDGNITQIIALVDDSEG